MTDSAIRLGSILFTLVEPHPGHAVAYNRWYERDHFYAGCMIGAYTFAGQRWVATREQKAARQPHGDNAITGERDRGSYLALYWILAGHHDEWNRWGVDQVNWLHANGRMFAERDHVHTLLYNYDWHVSRDADGVPAELALDHRYPGLGVVVVDATDDRAAAAAWYRDSYLASAMPGATLAQCLAFSPRPLLSDAPSDVPRTSGDERRLLLLFFLDERPDGRWDAAVRDQVEGLRTSGAGTLAWASPFIPTIPGTDTYTDEL